MKEFGPAGHGVTCVSLNQQSQGDQGYLGFILQTQLPSGNLSFMPHRYIQIANPWVSFFPSEIVIGISLLW